MLVEVKAFAVMRTNNSNNKVMTTISDVILIERLRALSEEADAKAEANRPKNAYEELDKALKGVGMTWLNIAWANVKQIDWCSNEEIKSFGLAVVHKLSAIDSFQDGLKTLPTTDIRGIVMLSNGAWFERGEYDGSEWWAYREVPKCPDYLNNVKGMRSF